MVKHMFSKYALGITAAAMMTIPAAGIAGATSISPNGSTSDSGSNVISTVTDITTPAPEDDEVTLDEPTHKDPVADPAPDPAEENSADTDNSTLIIPTIFAVFAALFWCVYLFIIKSIT